MTNKKIEAVLLEALGEARSEGKNIAWRDIVKKVEGAGFSGNWLKVRGVLQGLIDDGICVRTDSIHVEEYEVLKG